ncbi:MAG: hypothetical protein N3H30_00675 [Candidatus Micrarchaeota archaeon]|nr:hypothetical protein [Candidatus Micrarchaeota archaeon]
MNTSRKIIGWNLTCMRKKRDGSAFAVEPNKLKDLIEDYAKFEEMGRQLNILMKLGEGLPPINMMKVTHNSEIIEEDGQITIMCLNEKCNEAITLTIFVANAIRNPFLFKKDE